MVDLQAKELHRDHVVSTILNADKGTDFVVEIGNSGYVARISYSEALDIARTVGKHIDVQVRNGEIELVGL